MQKVRLLQKTASRAKNFIDSKGIGPWFIQLVSSRDSCQPSQGIEPGDIHDESYVLGNEKNDADVSLSQDKLLSAMCLLSKQGKGQFIACRRRHLLEVPTSPTYFGDIWGR